METHILIKIANYITTVLIYKKGKLYPSTRTEAVCGPYSP